MSKAVVYLDQNKWIELARANTARGGNSTAVYEGLEAARQEGRALFPMSFSTQYETTKINNRARRQHLAVLQASLSAGWVLKSRASNLAVEVAQALRRLFSVPAENLPETWFLSRGLLDAFSSAQWATTPLQVQNAVRAIAGKMSPEQQVMILLDQPDEGSRRALVRKLSEQSLSLLADIERRRERLRTETRSTRDKAYAARLFIDHMPVIEAGLRSLGKSFDDLKALGDAQMRAFFDDIPTLYVERRMADLLETLDRRVKENDLRDMSFMYCAVPYCRYIVAEKMFINLARQAGLDKRFGVGLLTRLEDAADLLRG